MEVPMAPERVAGLIAEVAAGRTDCVFELRENLTDEHGISLIQHCAYYGDVSAIRYLVERGASLKMLGEDLGLNGAAFHGHWRLCAYALESGADANAADAETGETPLHAALCTTDRVARDVVLRVLLAAGADVNRATIPGRETGGFMRDVRTRGETPLHRAAAFGTEETIALLLEAGAKVDARDVNGDSPLSWASWHLRPDSILRMLCFGGFRIRPDRKSMKVYLTGEPASTE
jgi:ankyrin repeat protein